MKPLIATCILLSALLSLSCPAEQAEATGFTGLEVPALAPLLGDYVNVGVRTPQGNTDINRLLTTLKEMGAKDYMHLVWQEKQYPEAWRDFLRIAPEFQKENIGLWLYLTPPSEGVPEPYGDDYIKWAVECAKAARENPIIKGVCIDDFNGNVGKFTPAYCKEMMGEAHKIAPHLSLLVVCYFGYQESIAAHVEEGVIDGVIFPYFYPHKNLSDTSALLPQITTYRAWLDEHTATGGFARKMPLVVMIYGVRHSQSSDEPTPAYVKRCLEIGLQATNDGAASGVVTYCLPKDKPEFVKNVAAVYRGYPSTPSPAQ